METQVLAKWGNSLGLRIPASMAKQAGLAVGMNVTVTFINGALVVKPERKKKYTLDELLEGMPPEQVHAEVDMGHPLAMKSGSQSSYVPNRGDTVKLKIGSW